MNRLPVILPEESAPEGCRSCQRCELSGHGTRMIWGEGSSAASTFVVLDNPGAREDREGRPFLCGTRETLQQAAYEAGFEPGSLYVSYLLKCRPRRAYDKPRARSICIRHLWEQLKEASPIVVICLGNVVCQSIFGEPDASVKELRGRMHSVKGYPVVVSYHPLAVRRRPVLYRHFLEDWQRAFCQLKQSGEI